MTVRRRQRPRNTRALRRLRDGLRHLQMMLDVKVSGSITSRTVQQTRADSVPRANQASLASARVARARAPSRERGNNYRLARLQRQELLCRASHCRRRPTAVNRKHKALRFGKGFNVVLGNRRSQAAQMVLMPGKAEGSTQNHHRGSDQWLLVRSEYGKRHRQRAPLSTRPGCAISHRAWGSSRDS